MKHFLPIYILLLVCILTSFSSEVKAQNRQQQFTTSNVILIGFESPKGLIEFRSDDMQVRYLKETQQIECRVRVNSFYTLNDTIPTDMAHEVLYGSRFPEIVFYIEAPNEVVNAPRQNADPLSSRATIEFQGNPKETRIPVVFASEQGVINLSTNFEIWMGQFSATIPAKYAPLLTGRLHFTIRNARWVDNTK